MPTASDEEPDAGLDTGERGPLIPVFLEDVMMGPSGPASAPSRRTSIRRSSKAITPGGSQLPAELADVKQRGDVVIETDADDDSPGQPAWGEGSPKPRQPELVRAGAGGDRDGLGEATRPSESPTSDPPTTW